MQELMWIGIGVLLGGTAVGLFMIVRKSRAGLELANARTRAEILDTQVNERETELQGVRQELGAVNERREAAEKRVAELNEQFRAEERRFAEQKSLLDKAEEKLKDTFRAVGADALAANSKEFLVLAKKAFEGLMTEAKGDVEKKQQAIDALLKPIREALEKHHAVSSEMEKKREVDKKGLEEQIKMIAASHERLGTETGRLVSALRRPEQRGRWGELQLKNTVELAGMTEHCDFETQPQTDDPTTHDRPDMIVNIPGGGVIIVDSKVALDAYLDSVQPDADREALLARHARQVSEHYRKLARKEYWKQFERTPEFVVMFMPLESALLAALDVNPHLHAEAMANHVIIATPSLLVALLRAIAYGWQQEDVAANAREIADAGRELYARLATFVEHFEKIGTHLKRGTAAYGDAIGSLERNLLPSARRMKQLNVTSDDEIEAPPAVEIEVRQITSPELNPAGEPDQG